MDVDLIFFEAFSTCPWYSDDTNSDVTAKCTGQVTYNGHVNDPRYGKCTIHTCPIWFWINAFATLKTD